MTNASKRKFKEGQYVYVVDYWGTSNGMQAFEATAKILKVDEQRQTFLAVLYSDTYKTYSFKDYGRLIFDTQNQASEAAEKLLEPKMVVYQIAMDNQICKRQVLGIGEKCTEGICDLVIRLDNGESVSTKEIGHSIFLNESGARKK